MSIKTADVPASMDAEFRAAERYVEKYFETMKMDPRAGTITVGDDRYVILRASSLSIRFLEFVKGMYPALDPAEALDASSRVQYDLAHAIGRSDARHFQAVTGVTAPIERFSTGPVHFAYTGWARVAINETSRPSADEEYFLEYDHLNTFEADSWLASRGRTDFCTCFWSAGYSAGWCTESFGLPLDAREVACRAKGDPSCHFVMTHRDRMTGVLRKWKQEHPLVP